MRTSDEESKRGRRDQDRSSQRVSTGVGEAGRMSLRLTPHYPLIAVAVPMVVWAVHLVVVYSLVGLACERGILLRPVAMLPLLSWLLVLVTLLALGAIAWLGWRAWRRWSALGGERLPHVQPRERFMRLVTAMLALLAFIAVVFTATPIFMLQPCT